MIIDRNKPLDVCKIEVCNYVKLKKDKDGVSISKAFELISEEIGIPSGTIKRWFYPSGYEKWDEKRKNESCITCDTIDEDWDDRIPENQRDAIRESFDEEMLDAFMSGVEKQIMKNVRERKRVKNEKRREKLQKIQDKIDKGDYSEIPEGRFGVIVIDPPWNYGTNYDVGGRRVASPYPEMNQEQLKEIVLPALNDSVLFLWSTHKFLWDAKELLDYWGFTHRATLVWNKEKIGMGDLFRMQCEFCLVGIKGNPVFNNDNTHRDLISAPRRKHSQKPDEFYEMVEKLCVGCRKLDYFAREQRMGWSVYGVEVINEDKYDK